MAILAKASDKEFEKFPLPNEGTARAVCAGVWDIGMQKTVYNGQEKIQHKVIIAWEIDQLIDAPDSEYNGKPYMLSKTYTLSLFENARLRRDLESWRGKAFTENEINEGFDVERLYGANCLVGVAHVTKNERTFANITSILPPIKGMEKLTPVRAKDEPAPKWVQEKAAATIQPEEENPFGLEPAGPDIGDGENIHF
jgi:hypothetical protein